MLGQITTEQVKLLITTIDAGLTEEIGQPVPGKMCVEAAVCYALGLPHGDNPQCVLEGLRQIKIIINVSSHWISNQSRANGLKKLAILQLGTKGTLDEIEFTKRIALMVVNKVTPRCLNRIKISKNIIDNCIAAITLKEASSAADAAARAAEAAAARPVWAVKTIGAAKIADFAAAAAMSAGAAGAAKTVDSAAWAAEAAARAAWVAKTVDSAAWAAEAAAEAELLYFVDNVARILIDMKVPGIEWLYLLEE